MMGTNALWEKHKRIYGDDLRRPLWDLDESVRSAIYRVHSVANTNRHNETETLTEWMDGAVRDNNLAAARYLLMVGLPPRLFDHSGAEFIVGACVRCNMPEMGALLRKHGARLPAYAETGVKNAIEYYNHWSRRDFARVAERRKLWESVRSPDEAGCAQVSTYEHSFAAGGGIDARPKTVMPSWPPRGVPQHPPPESLLPPPTHLAVLDLWHAVGTHRRAEARVLAPLNWARVRRWLRVRAVVHYWLGATQERLCAPDGKGRAQDLAAYRDAFA